MRLPPNNPARVLKQKAQAAIAELKKRRDFPRVHLEAMNKAQAEDAATDKSQFDNQMELSPARLQYEIKILDIWAGAYVQLVNELAEQSLFIDTAVREMGFGFPPKL